MSETQIEAIRARRLKRLEGLTVTCASCHHVYTQFQSLTGPQSSCPKCGHQGFSTVVYAYTGEPSGDEDIDTLLSLLASSERRPAEPTPDVRLKWETPALRIVEAIHRDYAPSLDSNDGGEIFRWILDLVVEVAAAAPAPPQTQGKAQETKA